MEGLLLAGHNKRVCPALGTARGQQPRPLVLTVCLNTGSTLLKSSASFGICFSGQEPGECPGNLGFH